MRREKKKLTEQKDTDRKNLNQREEVNNYGVRKRNYTISCQKNGVEKKALHNMRKKKRETE